MKTKENIINFIKKFKLESITIVVISLFAAFIDEIERIMSEKIFEMLIILLFIVTGSFLVDKIFAVYEDFIKQKITEKSKSSASVGKKYLIIKIIFYLVVVSLEYLFYKFSIYLYVNLDPTIKSIDDSNPETMALGFFLVSIMAVSLISYFVIKEKKYKYKKLFIESFC